MGSDSTFFYKTILEIIQTINFKEERKNKKKMFIGKVSLEACFFQWHVKPVLETSYFAMNSDLKQLFYVNYRDKFYFLNLSSGEWVK